MPNVRILSVDGIPLPPDPSPLLESIDLSHFDTLWVPLPPIQRLLLYEGIPLSAFPSIVQALKSSLSATLLRYYPLAGKLTYVPSTGVVRIDCSASAVGAGVAFVEAEADGDLARLAHDEEHDIPAFLQLVPEMDVKVLPAPVFAVQATRFSCGGLAIGFAAHHAVADGRALWQFVEAWTAACRGDPAVTPDRGGPTLDRAVVRHPSGEDIARRNLRLVAPALPVTTPERSAEIERRFQLARKTFVLGSDRILSLKQRILGLTTTTRGTAPSPHPPSTFTAIAALFWTAFARSKALKPDEETHLVFLADCRARLDPPVDEGYFGNCIVGSFATAAAGELLHECGLLRAASLVQNAVREFSTDPAAVLATWLERVMKLPFERVVNVAASPRFRVYEADFGWGRPSRVELVSMNHDGEVALAGGREEGSVQVSVSLHPDHIDSFKFHFLHF